MKTIAAYFFLLFLVGCSAQPPAALTAKSQKAQVIDSEAILGDWVIIEAMRNGEDYPSEVGGTTTFVRSSAIVRTNDGTETTYDVQFDQMKAPKHIDWTTTQEGVSMTLHGVYELLDEQLTICSPPNFNMERPEKIETSAGDGRWLFKLTRNSSITTGQ